jgi:hypothetical protein
MIKISARHCATLALVALLGGCAGSATSPTPIGSRISAAAVRPEAYHGLDDLYVADYGTGTIFLLKNDGYTPDGTITEGINGPWAATLDRSGNLYVANATGANVTEYAPGATSPEFTYSKSMTFPAFITVDRSGNLFEVDGNPYDGAGVLNEYSQGQDTVLHSCTVSHLTGVAVDRSGDVFITFSVKNSGGFLEEYQGGLAGCNPTPLGAHFGYTFSLALDRKNNILVGEPNSGRIDVVPPPYSSISRQLHTSGQPMFFSVNRQNTQVFVSSERFYNTYVFVVDYKTGKPVQRLGYNKGGFSIPYGVVDGPNTVL